MLIEVEKAVLVPVKQPNGAINLYPRADGASVLEITHEGVRVRLAMTADEGATIGVGLIRVGVEAVILAKQKAEADKASNVRPLVPNVLNGMKL